MPVASARKPVRLADLDQSKSHTPEKYREKLRAGHLRLLELQHALKDSKVLDFARVRQLPVQ